MFKPLKRDRSNVFSTLDIETDRQGNMIIAAIFDGEKVTYFHSWREFLHILYENNENPKYRRFVAHSGGSFDYVHLMEYLTDTDVECEIVMSNSQCIFIRLMSFDKPVILQDSSHVLKSSLKKLCKVFDVETPKEDIDINNIEEIWKTNPDKVMSYLRSDVISLYQVCREFMKILEIDFFPLTIASLAMYIYRRRFMQKEYFTITKARVDQFISQAYAGGRVECFRSGRHEQVYVYDINSLYPYAMKTFPVPVGLPTYTKKFRPDKYGFYRIKFSQSNTNIPPILWMKTRNGLEFVYEGEGTFYQAEVELAMKYGVNIEVLEGFVFHKAEYLFSDFVDHFYSLRQQYKGTAVDLTAKLVMNNLYGKFGQKPKSEKLVKWNRDTYKEKIRKVKNWKPYIEDKGLFIVEEPRKIDHRMIHYAAAITSHARCILYEYLVSHAKNVVYCDTDSLHLLAPMNSDFIGPELGKMKKEDEGCGIYIGRKQYTISEKRKFKGVKTNCNLTGAQLTIDKFATIMHNEVKYSYGVFPKLKTVLKGGDKACKIKIVEKRLRQGEYLSNFNGGVDYG